MPFSISQRVAPNPLAWGPIVNASNFGALRFDLFLPKWEGTILSASLYVKSTIATQATNYLTVTVVKTATSGAGADTVIATLTTNSSGGVAITTGRDNPMTMSAESVCRFATTDLITLVLTPATGTHVAIDNLTLVLTVTVGEAG